MAIYDIKINGLICPIGFDIEKPRVSWKVRNAVGKKQKKSKIEVSQSENFDKVDYTKEGQLNSLMEELTFELAPFTRYFLRVTVWTEAEDEKIVGESFFETGKLTDVWQGKWIGMESEDCFHPVFRKSFTPRKAMKSARLYISGLGLFEAQINGKKIGQDVLAPFISDYTEEIQYCSYEVEPLQENVEHHLDIYLGNGWYKGRFGFFSADETKRFLCIAELHCTYVDGSKEVIITDDSWEYKGSQWELTDIYDGETQNMLLWENQENPWKTAVECVAPGKLVDRHSLPLLEMEDVTVKEVIVTPKNEIVLDFGQNFAGYVICSKQIERGQKLMLEFGEILQEECFYNDNYRTAKATFQYISDGTKQDIKPHFTFFGFRYVRVTGVSNINAKDFVGKAVYSQMNQVGDIETSNEKINKLVRNTLWGQKSNFVEMPTDCPQRDERLAWTGDAQVFCRTGGYQMDTKAFYQKFVRDLRIDQLKNDGKVGVFLPNTVPDLTSCVWSDIATFMPQMLFEYYGDKIELAQNYPLMKDWVDWVTKQNREKSQTHLWDFGFHFGDWLALDGATEQSREGRTDKYFIASIYYYASASYVADAAKILDNGEEDYYRALSQKIYDAILHEYFSPSGRLAVDTQTGYLLALKFGVYPDKEKLIAALKERMKKDCYRIKGGFVGATMMNTVLGDNGLMNYAYDFLFFEGFPGWLYQVNLGATTIWERWNSVLPDGTISGTGMNSLNHYAWGSVVEFLYRNVAGITASEPGFAKIALAPIPDARLMNFRAEYNSAMGRIVSSWEVKKTSEITCRFEVPFNTEAKITLPYCEKESFFVGAGNYEYTYYPTEDLLAPFNENTRLEFMMTIPDCKTILEKYLPDKIALAENDIETSSKSISDFKREAIVLHTPTERFDQAVVELKKIRF